MPKTAPGRGGSARPWGSHCESQCAPHRLVRALAEHPQRTYESALGVLNSLQSNSGVLAAVHRACIETPGPRTDKSPPEAADAPSTCHASVPVFGKGNPMNERNLPEMRACLARMGYSAGDFDQLNIIHVTGTKGKGSVCAMTESVLRSAFEAAAPLSVDTRHRPLRTGLYTSPHLIDVCERIRLNGQPISQDAFARYFFETADALVTGRPPADASGWPPFSGGTVPPVAEHGPAEEAAPVSSPANPLPDLPPVSYFRFLTLMALHVFMREKVDVAILEVGIGGAYDSTNVIKHPLAIGITPVANDHAATLGTTRESVAWHKSGIIKPGCLAFATREDQTPAVLAMLDARAQELQAHGNRIEYVTRGDYPADVLDAVSLFGDHQRQNAALAGALARSALGVLARSPDPALATLAPVAEGDAFLAAMREGLSQVQWPARCQTIEGVPDRPGVRASEAGPRVLNYHVDGAHTPESLALCGQWVGGDVVRRSPGPLGLLFTFTHGRDPEQLLAALLANLPSGATATHPAGLFSMVAFCPAPVELKPGAVAATVSEQPGADPADWPESAEYHEQAALVEAFRRLAPAGAPEPRIFRTVDQAMAHLHAKLLDEQAAGAGGGGPTAGARPGVVVTGSLLLSGAVLSRLRFAYGVGLGRGV
ncbi:hypothetical protein H696_03338 [Fonticula alba]|uniref:tetrahydrofolate synthase n=1 Tax=Fonticula alba TaxID=691883 RepID=A0A058Z8L3_FONAL|nr:hypothetical protein H696_03338 [Fonticula alba]KCV69867.1 hypothetical protein H696_03338 [Fonticula alba]|eukprot:XP_009495473.1 hypothetical protein H696_03338 [Fonticula alba]